MFQGSSIISIDGKGRIAVPSRHRDVLLETGGKLTLTAHPEGQLLLYRDVEWFPVRDRINALPSTHKATRGLQRVIVGMAENVEMDGSGRLLVPPSLRDHAKLDKEVRLVGQGHRFEVWNTAAWDRMVAEAAEALGNMADAPPALQNFSL